MRGLTLYAIITLGCGEVASLPQADLQETTLLELEQTVQRTRNLREQLDEGYLEHHDIMAGQEKWGSSYFSTAVSPLGFTLGRIVTYDALTVFLIGQDFTLTAHYTTRHPDWFSVNWYKGEVTKCNNTGDFYICDPNATELGFGPTDSLLREFRMHTDEIMGEVDYNAER